MADFKILLEQTSLCVVDLWKKQGVTSCRTEVPTNVHTIHMNVHHTSQMIQMYSKYIINIYAVYIYISISHQHMTCQHTKKINTNMLAFATSIILVNFLQETLIIESAVPRSKWWKGRCNTNLGRRRVFFRNRHHKPPKTSKEQVRVHDEGSCQAHFNLKIPIVGLMGLMLMESSDKWISLYLVFQDDLKVASKRSIAKIMNICEKL